jgi:hypothetical protein
VFPLIPLLAIIAICGGGVTLPEQQQQEADRIACGYARDIFAKSMKELTKAEANHVAQLTKRHFLN